MPCARPEFGSSALEVERVPRPRKALVKFLLLLSAAWSAVGMEIHACSGPLSPGSCLQVLCNLILPAFMEGVGNLDVPAPDLGDSSESPPDSSHATTRAIDPTSVARSHRPLPDPLPATKFALRARTRSHQVVRMPRHAHSSLIDRPPSPLLC